MHVLERLQKSFYMAKIRGIFSRFVCLGMSYRYFCHRYNATWRNERAIEIPLILWVLQDQISRRGDSIRVLEFGNVLSHYTTLPAHIEHVVVDKYEVAPKVINTDILDFTDVKGFDIIVGISTLEHVGFDDPEEKDALKPLRAMRHLKTLLKPGGVGFLTIPVAYNPSFPLFLAARWFGFAQRVFFKRISEQNEWVQVPFTAVKDCHYGNPYCNANGLCFGFFK